MDSEPKQDLQGKRALVTGGAAGIGWAICEELTARGAQVVIADIDADKAAARAASLGEGHGSIGIDLSDLDRARALPAEAAGILGGLDIVVNNAGITDTSGRRIAEIPQDAFQKLIDINLGSVEAICQAGLDVLDANGVIVNLASGAAFRALPLRGAYSATKAAVVALTAEMNDIARARGHRVAAVAPGYVRTELVESLIAAGRLDPEAAAATVPLGRLGLPEDIARAVAMLVSPQGAPLAGACLAVDGGSQAAGGAGVKPPEQPARATAEGPLIVIGDGPQVASLRQALSGAGDVIAVASVEELAGAPLPRAVIDVGGLAETTATGAMLRARAIAAAVEAKAPGHGFSMLLATAGGTGQALAAMRMITRLIALEWAPFGHRVNAIACAPDQLPETAGLLSWLSADTAAYVTGQLMTVERPTGASAAQT